MAGRIMVDCPIPTLTRDMTRILMVATSVVIFHLAALWVFHSGLLHRTIRLIIPVQVLSEVITPPAPKPAALPAPKPSPPPKATQPEPPRPKPPTPALPKVAPKSLPSPQPLAVNGTAAPPSMPVPLAAPAPVAAAPAPVSAAVSGPPSPPRLQLPSSAADYLNNPPPEYPRLSRRMGEQGKVVVRVLIGVDGMAQKAEINTSSGFERLDQAALTTVLRWRYVPGKRGGIAEAMWFNVPINFVLE